jgi:hypothetical protein
VGVLWHPDALCVILYFPFPAVLVASTHVLGSLMQKHKLQSGLVHLTYAIFLLRFNLLSAFAAFLLLLAEILSLLSLLLLPSLQVCTYISD